MNSSLEDKKEKQLLNHYLTLLQRRSFDEYDVYAFLILVRPYVKGKWLKEITNLIAHRVREKGEIYKIIETTILNCNSEGEIKLMSESKRAIGYKGMRKGVLQGEIKRFVESQGITLDNITLNEIVLCIFSILSSSVYKIENVGTGIIRLISLGYGKELWLGTEVWYGNKPKGTLAFSKLDNNKIRKSYPFGWIKEPIEVLREQGELAIYCGGEKIS